MNENLYKVGYFIITIIGFIVMYYSFVIWAISGSSVLMILGLLTALFGGYNLTNEMLIPKPYYDQ